MVDYVNKGESMQDILRRDADQATSGPAAMFWRDCADMLDQLDAVRDEIEQLRKALRFYGKDAVWSSTVIDKHSGELTLFDWDGDVQDEPWEVAERALQEKNND